MTELKLGVKASGYKSDKDGNPIIEKKEEVKQEDTKK